jgi:hypothetical protein
LQLPLHLAPPPFLFARPRGSERRGERRGSERRGRRQRREVAVWDGEVAKRVREVDLRR